MERNKTIMKLCYLQTTFYIVFLTALITRHRRGNKSENLCFSDYFIPCRMCCFPYFRGLYQKYDPKFRL